jgi:hypothetical protein
MIQLLKIQKRMSYSFFRNNNNISYEKQTLLDKKNLLVDFYLLSNPKQLPGTRNKPDN